MGRYRYSAALVLLLGGIALAQTVFTSGSGAPVGACDGPKVWLSQTNPQTSKCCIGATWSACPSQPASASASAVGGVKLAGALGGTADLPTISYPVRVAVANVTNSTTSAANVTGLSWPVLANTEYGFHCVISHQGVATAGPRFGLSGPASPTHVAVRWERATSATAEVLSTDNAFSDSAQTAAVTSGGVTTPVVTRAYGHIINGANVGTANIHLTSSAATNTVTVFRGSYCDVRP
jgi:hypothetical protein